MTRYIFLVFFLLVGIVLFSRTSLQKKIEEVPYFLRFDELASQHQAEIKTNILASFPPSEEQVKILEKDYLAIWAHLNQLYETNDLRPRKERFTEKFYQSLAKTYQGNISGAVQREDLSHQLYVINWSRDGLACQLVDSAVVLNYKFPQGATQSTQAVIAMVLHFQGDNWRLDGLKIIEEKPLNP